MIPQAITSKVQNDMGGRPVDRHRGTTGCATCGAVILAGADITGYAYRPMREPAFHLLRLFCNTCARRRISSPTLGAFEVLFEATVTLRSQSLVLDGISPIDYSRPTQNSVNW